VSRYILAHDLGTSGNKATVYDFEGQLVAFSVDSYPTFYPSQRFVEQNPDDWWSSVCKTSKKILANNNIRPSDIACVTLSGQMMGCVLTDKYGESLRNAIIWADSRAGVQEDFLRKQMDSWEFYKITGHRPASFYSLAKLLWVKENEPTIYKNTYKMLNAKDYIIHKLTGVFATDYSDASGTNLLELESKNWSSSIIKAAGIEAGLLPKLLPSTDTAGKITKAAATVTGLSEGTPVVMGGGDGSCAAVGAGAVTKGSVYVVIGSSSWIAHTTSTPIYDPHQKTFTWVALDKDLYTPCGTMQAAGYSVNWFNENIGETQISNSPGADGLFFLPYLLGERSPRWDANARASFIGLTMTHKKPDMARAVLEGVGYNLKIILDLICKTGTENITAIGGGAKNTQWLQILADIFETPIQIPAYLEEATSLGAAICAGVGIGAIESFAAAAGFNKTSKTLSPQKENASLYRKMYKHFDRLYYALDGANHGTNHTDRFSSS